VKDIFYANEKLLHPTGRIKSLKRLFIKYSHLITGLAIFHANKLAENVRAFPIMFAFSTLKAPVSSHLSI